MGERLQHRRRALGHRRIDAARVMGVDPKTVMWWERDTHEPVIHHWPGVIQYLGYEPWPEPQMLPKKLLAERRRRGLSIAEAAHIVGVDEGTFGRWETGEWKPQPRTMDLVLSFIKCEVLMRAKKVAAFPTVERDSATRCTH